MKRIDIILIIAIATSLVYAGGTEVKPKPSAVKKLPVVKPESVIKSEPVTISNTDADAAPLINEQYGKISGRVQSLSMYRDYETLGNGANSTLALVLGYVSPEFAGVTFGATYVGAGEIFDNNRSGILANDPVNLLNEAWARYNLGALELTNTTITVGRQVNNGEIFRADDYRQKARAIDAVQVSSTDIKDTAITVGHARAISSWIQAGDRWEFNNFSNVFSAPGATISNRTDGITWAEAVYSGIANLDVAVFDAYAWDIVNMFGGRAKWGFMENSALLAYFRHENEVGAASRRNTDMYGLSVQQKVGKTTIEAGYLGVHGATLRFNELTTGFNHALGASLMVYSGQYNGGADTAYLKATTKVGDTKLYCLYNYTWHDHAKSPFNGQELDIIVKQPILENLTVALKGGIGYRNGKDSSIIGNTTATDARLFFTYVF
ncbi:MAG: OprD family outer membrane porin [Kiritimatiellae bacterium]|nr:OprD family outer membrane porin [Kiritimatiellia bacterium]